eukprot:4639332-Ditylum_brightwellii.AAC.1
MAVLNATYLAIMVKVEISVCNLLSQETGLDGSSLLHKPEKSESTKKSMSSTPEYFLGFRIIPS